MAQFSPLTVYKASAGSGKTFTLTAEYIAFIVRAAARGQHEAFRHIVAVTFTIKATGEMKDRILGTLYNLANITKTGCTADDISDETVSYLRKITLLTRNALPFPCPPDEEIATLSVNQLLALPSTPFICNAAASSLIKILHNYDSFKVTTIDSFFQSVLKGVARELGLPANLRTEISDDEVRHLAIERLMDTLDRHPDLQHQIWNFVKDKLDDGKTWNVNRLLETFAQQLGKEEYSVQSNQLQNLFAENPEIPETVRQELLRIKNTIEKQVRTQSERVLQLIPPEVMNEPLFFTNTKSRLKIIQDSCNQMLHFELEPVLKSTLSKFLNRPATMLNERTNANAAAYDRCLSLATEIATAFTTAFELYKQQLITHNTISLVLANLHQLGLLTTIDRTVNEINSERGQFLLSHTGRLLKDLMNSEHGGNTDFVFEKIGPTLNHIMIDEFQDTSDQQWQNFRPLIEELMSRTDSSNLIVGDVKQSIYRWRNGKWEILGNIEHEFPGRVHTEPLIYNFRSDPTIIDFNNFIFPRLANLLDRLAYDNFAGEGQSMNDFRLISDAYAPEEVCQHIPQSKAATPATGKVRLKIYHQKLDDNLFDDICTQVSELHQQGVPYADMAILVRSGTIVPELIEAFKNHKKTLHVKLAFSNACMLQSSIAVQMIIAALRFLDNPNDLISKAFLVFHYQKTILGTKLSDDTLLQARPNSENCYLPDFLQYEYENLKRLPLYELNEQLIIQMQLEQQAGQAEFLMTYLDNVKSYTRNNPADLGSFLDFWDSELKTVAIKSMDNDVLHIFTIHASKGLAFKHVFMPDCSFRLSVFHKNEIHWLPTEKLTAPFKRLPTLPIDFFNTRKMQASEFAPFYQHEVYQQFMDTINLLYVGFTRAKKSLYIWSFVRPQELKVSASTGTALKSILQKYQKELFYKSDNISDTYIFDADHHSPEFSEIFPKHIPPATKEKRRVGERESRMEPTFAGVLPCRMANASFTPHYKRSKAKTKMSGHESANTIFARIDEGNIFHEILSLINTAADLDKAIARYAQENILKPEMEKSFRTYFAEGLKRQDITDWFSENYNIYNEQNIIYRENNTVKYRRPDRVMISRDGRRLLVIEFKFLQLKTAKEQKLYSGKTQLEEYQRQVADYMYLMQKMMPDKKISGYLWFIKDNQVIPVKMEASTNQSV